jgi:hypothetical protein
MTVFEKCKAIKIIFNFIHKNFIFTLSPYSVKDNQLNYIYNRLYNKPILIYLQNAISFSRNFICKTVNKT